MTGTPERPLGVLWVVGTPIGNLEDLSARAIATLRRAALVACEDTRVTRAILVRHGIDVPVVSCHRFNETHRARRILKVLEAGGDVALVSDSGTPGVSDPGAAVVAAARAAGFRVAPVPGPTAAATLWSVSGLEGPFTFVGFLPHRRGERRRVLERLRVEPRALLFYESPHRIAGMLRDAAEILGDRRATLGRELTKMHEEVRSATLSELAAETERRVARGEFTLVVEPAGAAVQGIDAPAALEAAAGDVRARIARGEDRREALRHAARTHGVRRRALYAHLVETGIGNDEEE